MLISFSLSVFMLFSMGCTSPEKGESLVNSEIEDNLSKLKLPSGFEISIFAEVNNARSLAISPSGTVFVGNRNGGKVYAVKDNNGDGKADVKYELASGLRMPNGVAFKDGDLYIADISTIYRFRNIESKLSNPGQPEVVYDEYPSDRHHGWKFIAFGPDGKLYVPVGAPCNICESKDEVYASITRINPDGTGREVYAHGIRNTVGFDWHPGTGELWFTDNGRDMLGDDIPPCELNKVSVQGQHFGYPYCHGGRYRDPEFGIERTCDEFVNPELNFIAHTAPLGMRFYSGNMFPSSYRNQILVAQHGSWNRSTKSGYKVLLVTVENNKAVKDEVFIEGWLNDATQAVWGRPVDILQLEDGSILISDDHAGLIYRVTYKG